MATKITLTTGTSAINAAGEIETPVDVICKDGRKPIVGEEFEFFIDGKSIDKKKTDAKGKVAFVAKCPAGTKTAKLEVKSAKGNADHTLDMTKVANPAQTTPPPPPEPKFDPKDPVEIQVLRSELATAGQFRLTARVLNHKGDGLEKKVGFLINGVLTEVDTNEEGVCQFPNPASTPITLKPGEEKKVQAFVSGISALTTTNICRRKKISAKNKAAAQANNKIAKRLFIAGGIFFAVWTVISIAIASTSGLGEPLLASWHEPTSQEKFFNSIAEGTSFAKNPAKENIGHWQKPAIFLPLGLIILWFISTFIYGITAMREEVAEAWRAGMEAIADKHFVKAQDPAFERFFSKLGYLSKASVRPASTAPAANTTAAPVSTTTPASSEKRLGFWNYFSADILSEFLIELLPRIFKAIIR